LIKIVLSHALYQDGMDLLAKQRDVQFIVADEPNPQKILPLLRDADGFILRIGRMTRDMFDQCPRIKVVTRPGVGVDTIDVDYATSLGIPVVVTPGANVRSTAEHTLTVLLTVAKNIVESYEHTRDGDFAIRNKYASVEMLGKTVGVLGYGNIGREIAKLCKALDMKVAIYDPFVSQQRVEDDGYEFSASLEEMLKVCDAVTLHMPATPQTRNIISAERLGLFKKSAFLINCARGDLVDEAALYDALKSGALAGAAADMMAVEPMDPKSPLFTLPNFIATPHMAALTQESAARSGIMAVEGTLAVIRGEKWPHVFNKNVYEHKKWSR
jgi:D-3-phosphoglycerate dehydrogenase